MPATADAIYFTKSAANAMTTNGDQSAKNFTEVKVTEAYTGDVGTAANPLKAGMDAVVIRGDASYYIAADDTGAAEIAIDEINQFRGTLYVTALTAIAGKDTAIVRLMGGTMFLQNGDFTQVDVIPLPSPGGALIIESGVDQLDILNVKGGQVETEFASHNVVNVDAGLLVLSDASAITTGSAKLTIKGGRVRYNTGGATTNVEIRGGLLTAAHNQIEAAVSLGTLDAYGGTVNLRNGAGNVHGTGTINNRGSAVKLALDPGKTITLGDI